MQVPRWVSTPLGAGAMARAAVVAGALVVLWSAIGWAIGLWP
jgi:hypothetical protein